ncbi:MAG: outer membrane lipoprotein chaperone LolA [Gammaproteobacteria bacterium]
MKIKNLNFKKFFFIVSNMIFVIALSANNSAIAANAVSKYFGDIKSFKVTFTQKSIELDSSSSKISKGYLIVKNPDKFYLEYTKPYKLIYVADGKKLWSYDEDLEQVIVKSQANLLVNTPAMILSQPQDIEKKYKVKALGTEHEITRYKLIPKEKNSTFEFIIIGFIDGDLKLMEMLDNFGQHTMLRFDKIQKNPSLDSNTFKFIPPEGVDVISDEVSS